MTDRARTPGTSSAQASAQPRWRLVPRRTGGGPPVNLGAWLLTVGRNDDNMLPLPGERTSRYHCVIEPLPEGAGYQVRDLGSRNGTRVNEERVQTALLKPGDVLRIGEHEFLVDGPPPGPGKPPRPPGARDPDAIPISRLLPDAARPARPPGPAPDATQPLEHHAGDEPTNAPTPEALTLRDEERPPGPWAGELDAIMGALPPREAAPEKVAIIDAQGQPSRALDQATDGPRALRLLLQTASKSRATDVHMEPKADDHFVRLRVDGQMVELVSLPTRVGELVYGIIKTAAQMKLAARDAVQEGHFSVRFPDRRVEYRVSFTPSVHGQKLVLRVLDQRGAPGSLFDLGMAPYMVERVRRTCSQDHGLLLACGPTGSGKTTTLYNAMRSIDRRSRNVVTIEDPVEYQLDGVTQIPIDDAKGNTFGSLLRSVLRQDPDVILVGEIRDEETARTAMQAAMTGHLVFTTIHSKDSMSAVFRLLDLRVEPYLVANALDLVLAQRLVRLLCDNCKREITVPPGDAARLGKHLGGKTRMYVPVGCARCLRTGFRGRRALFELLDFTDELRDVVLREPTIAAMKRVIETGLFTTLTQFGWRLVGDGVTSLDEVSRVAGSGS